jgi:hypothetical protein
LGSLWYDEIIDWLTDIALIIMTDMSNPMIIGVEEERVRSLNLAFFDFVVSLTYGVRKSLTPMLD